MTSLPYLAAYIVATYLVLHYSYNIFLHPLRKYPGPRLRAASQIPFLLGLISGRHHLIIKDLHEQYGTVVRFAPGHLSYITTDAWREIYGHKKYGQPEMSKEVRFNVPDPNAPTVFLSSRKQHSHYRRLLSHGFSDRALREQEPLLRGYTDLLVKGLARVSKNGKPVNLVEWFNMTTFDIIGDLTFGEPFGCLETGTLHPWVRGIFDGLKAITYLAVAQHIPLIGPYTQDLLKLVMINDAFKERRAHFNYCHNKVTRRLNNTSHRPDFMEGILNKPPGKGMVFPELVSHSSVLVIAGSETTATLLSGAMYLLMTNPDNMQKLVEEVRGTFGSPDEISIEAINRLVYLQAVIEESLRFYPPVATGLHREVPKGGWHIDGRYVPARTAVTVSHYAAYHSPTNFQQQDEFIPERFIDKSAFDDNRDVLQPFHVGPRNCIGKNLAYAEMKLILACLVYHFDFQLSEESTDWLDQKTFLIWEKHPLQAHLSPARPPSVH
ncbi:hypothetical protein BDW74DRAFT_164408 [Aspergillus multicolor]|uniref:cytochrome P450 n=1 Tax=Aspergillus multicolor TaxID=41759 RepID=UPI003CCCEFEA